MGNVIASLDQKEYQTLLSYILDLPNSVFVKNTNLQNYKKIIGKANLDKYKVIGENQDIYIIPLDKKQTQTVDNTNIGQEIMRIIFYHLLLIENPNQSIFSYLKDKKELNSVNIGYYIPNELLEFIKTNSSIYVTESTLQKNSNVLQGPNDIFNTSRSIVPSIVNNEIKKNIENRPFIIKKRIMFVWSNSLLNLTPSQDLEDYKDVNKVDNIKMEQYYGKHKNSNMNDILPHIDSILDYIERHNEEDYQKLKEKLKDELYMDDNVLKTSKFKKIVDYTQTSGDNLISSLFVNLPINVDITKLTNNPYYNQLQNSRFVKYAEIEKQMKSLIKNDLLKNYTLCSKSTTRIPVLSDKTGACYTNTLINSDINSYNLTHKLTASVFAECLSKFFEWFINDMDITIKMIKHLRNVKE
jgi:hypothetical protein